MSQDSDFFANLPEVKSFSEVVRTELHHDAPGDWHIVVTDVVGSTAAIEAGRYCDVNALGVGTIISLCNAVPEVEIPYVFGGDGATLVVPEQHLSAYLEALRGMRLLAEELFALQLRVAHIPVRELVLDGHPVRVGRYRSSPTASLAVFSGSGFRVAEDWVKDPSRGERYAVSEHGPSHADLEGFECRWQPFKSERGQIVSLLVSALPGASAEEVYSRVLRYLEELHGGESQHPLRQEHLRMRGVFGDYTTEAKLRSQRKAGAEYKRALAHAREKALIGRSLIWLSSSAGGFDGSRYPGEFIQNSDFRKFDETLRMVLDLPVLAAKDLESWLEGERARGQLVFGMHRAPAALATCMVRNYNGNHLHFIDGADGGYALAARQLKQQLKELGIASIQAPSLPGGTSV